MAEQTLLLAAEEKSGLFLILPQTEELIWGAIAFAVLALLIWRFAGPAIKNTLDARQAAVTGSLEDAETAKQEAQSLLEDYRQQLAQAQDESNRIIGQARQTADAIRQETVDRANAEAEEIRQKAREDAAAEMERAREGLRSEVANLSIDLAERVVQESLDRETQLGLVERYIEELERT
ncbi:MAG: F0F1 ATP synthase subunit B [Acidimicrobiia bacterium]